MLKTDILEFVETHGKEFTDLSDRIWEYAETCFKEQKSSADQIEILKKYGFSIATPVADMDTAFIAEYGSGKPVLAFLGEYDALPGLSQKADVTEPDPLEDGGNGHGCGHNILGSGMVEAVCATREMIEKYHMEGTIRYYGCPAEEGGGGKVFMVRAGAFDDVDAVLSWHPGYGNFMMTPMLGCITASYEFTCRDPRNPHIASMDALDAAELMNTSVQYLREHILPGCRLEYAVLNPGGSASNMPKKNVKVLYCVRAASNQYVKFLFDRLTAISKGIAIVANVEVSEPHITNAYASFIPNNVLQEALYKICQENMPVSYTDEELEYARKFQPLGRGANRLDPIDLKFEPYRHDGRINPASTDVGDVSMVAPTCGCHFVINCTGTLSHSIPLVAQGKSSIAHKGLHQCGKVFAEFACQLLSDEELLQNAKAEFDVMRNGESFKTFLPENVTPRTVLRDMYS
jgi:aminobenzoyl-glutamate utilization protein B